MPRPTLAPPSEFRPLALRRLPGGGARRLAPGEPPRRGGVADRERQDAPRARRDGRHANALPLPGADPRALRPVGRGAGRRLGRPDRPFRRRRAGDGSRHHRHVRRRLPAHGGAGRQVRPPDRRRGAPLRAGVARRGAGDVDRAAAARAHRHAARAGAGRRPAGDADRAGGLPAHDRRPRRPATWRRSSGSPGGWRSTPTSAASTTPSGRSTARRGARSRGTTSAARPKVRERAGRPIADRFGTNSCARRRAPTRGAGASRPGGGRGASWRFRAASARRWRCCSATTARNGRWSSWPTTRPPTPSRGST